MQKALFTLILSIVVFTFFGEALTSSFQESKTEKSLLIGLIPEQNIFRQMERYEILTDYLSRQIGIKIKLTTLLRYGFIIDNFVKAGMDGAFFGSFTYALAHAKLGLEVLARPETLDGRSTYHGLIFVRKDSAIRNAEDMKGKRFVLVDKATTAGFLLPLVYFKKHGIKDFMGYLQEGYFIGTHEDAIYDVLNRKADIGAAKNTVLSRLAKLDSRIEDELLILEQSPPVPENGLAVRRDLESSIKEKLKMTLLDMDKNPHGKKVLEGFGAKRFIETTDNDYETVLKYAKEAGLDLATYDYLNY